MSPPFIQQIPPDCYVPSTVLSIKNNRIAHKKKIVPKLMEPTF